ncbi:UNVERIFIED_CONTAM: hypothetical protein H355_013405, partial [Colinus virginianus]
KFRIINLDDDLMVIKNECLQVWLQDPEYNRIAEWMNVKSRHGIVDLSFPLASEAVLGEYTIFVQQDMAQTKFSVKEYGKTKVAEVREKHCGYTYGRPAQGKIDITFITLLQFEMNDFSNSSEMRKQQSWTDKNGCANFTVTTKALELNESESSIIVIGEMEEAGTGAQTKDLSEISIVTRMKSIEFVNIHPFYKRGLPYSGQMFCHSGDSPLQNEMVYLTVDVDDEKTYLSFLTDEEGKVHFSLNTTNWNTSLVSLTTKSLLFLWDVLEMAQQNWQLRSVFAEVQFQWLPSPCTCVIQAQFVRSGTILVFSAVSRFCLVILIAYSYFCTLKGTYYLRNDTNDNYGQNTGIGESFHWLKPFYSESNSFLEIKARNDVMPCDQEQDVQVDYILDQNKLSSEIDHVDFYYMNLGPSMALLFALQVIAKGRILFSGEKQVPVLQHENLHGSFSLTLTIGNDFLLDIKLLVYTLFLDGEVVADVEEFQVAKCFRHKVELDFSSKQEVPGSKVSLNLKAAPGSFCSVQSVDKRVLLMKNNILTADTLYKKVFDDSFTIGGRGFPYHLEDFDAYPCLPQQSSLLKKAQMGAPWYQSDADVFNLFKLLRMKILTNTKIKKPVSCMHQNFERKMLTNKDSVVDSHVVHANLAPQSDDTKKPKPRTHFPETWIWDLVPVSDDGQASLQVTVPDTITEWNANTFCVANTGFGLSHLTTLTVFQPFFVDLSLPYSVTQGEIFSLKATVFNYLKDCIQVHTTLIETPELKVDACPSCQFTSCLCANEAKTFVWNVTAIRLGKVNVTVSSVAEESHNLCDNRVAVTPLQGETDTVIKPLLVKPGGILQERTQNAFLCATDFWFFLSSDNTVLEEFSLILPAETLEGSGQATFSVIGDKGFPCSWNMVLFAPNIFILQYLKKTKQLDPEIEATALYFLRTGYQRQLLYKHDDGSYSAFGKSDTQGNTWLTAFVARSFGQASSYIYINKDHVQDAVLWLQKHQLSNGCFQSVGKLFNNDLKGGVNDMLSLTAYIAAALLELQLEKNAIALSIHTGEENQACTLNKKLVFRINQFLAELFPRRMRIWGQIFSLDLSVFSEEEMESNIFSENKSHWGDWLLNSEFLQKVADISGVVKETATPPCIANVHRGLKFFSSTFLHVSAEHLTSDSSSERSSSMIEIVAYILLAHVSKPDFAVSESAVSKLVHWLSKQRNALGGFASTQDTVVSLQALAQYAALIPHEIRDVKVTVKGKEASPLEFHVHKNNKLVLHQASLLEIPGMYKVEATGRGCVYVQSTLYYNTLPPKTEVVFLLDVETVTRECDGIRKQFDIYVSVSYTGDRVTTNMALLQVDMLSGFIPIKKSVKELENVLLVKKTEIKPDKVIIYLEELDKTSLKLLISVEQDNEVQNLKPATVHVYDYYKPDDRTVREYNSPCNSDV